MANDNKLVKGMLIGATVGAAISMLDKETRHETVANLKGCSKKMWENVKHPSQTVSKISNVLADFNKQIQNVADDAIYILEKVEQVSNLAVEKKREVQESFEKVEEK